MTANYKPSQSEIHLLAEILIESRTLPASGLYLKALSFLVENGLEVDSIPKHFSLTRQLAEMVGYGYSLKAPN